MPKPILEAELYDIMEEATISKVDDVLADNIKYILDREGIKYYDVVIPVGGSYWEPSDGSMVYSADFDVYTDMSTSPYRGVAYGMMLPVDEDTVEIEDMTIELYETEEGKLSEQDSFDMVVTKEKLKDSGFGALWDPGDEWWAQCPKYILITVTPESETVRFCFDLDEEGELHGHSDDYYEYGKDAVELAAEFFSGEEKEEILKMLEE